MKVNRRYSIYSAVLFCGALLAYWLARDEPVRTDKVSQEFEALHAISNRGAFSLSENRLLYLGNAGGSWTKLSWEIYDLNSRSNCFPTDLSAREMRIMSLLSPASEVQSVTGNGPLLVESSESKRGETIVRTINVDTGKVVLWNSWTSGYGSQRMVYTRPTATPSGWSLVVRIEPLDWVSQQNGDVVRGTITNFFTRAGDSRLLAFVGIEGGLLDIRIQEDTFKMLVTKWTNIGGLWKTNAFEFQLPFKFDRMFVRSDPTGKRLIWGFKPPQNRLSRWLREQTDLNAFGDTKKWKVYWSDGDRGPLIPVDVSVNDDMPGVIWENERQSALIVSSGPGFQRVKFGDAVTRAK